MLISREILSPNSSSLTCTVFNGEQQYHLDISSRSASHSSKELLPNSLKAFPEVLSRPVQV